LTQNKERIFTEFKKLQLQRIQTKNNAVFIPDKNHKQFPPYQHKVCAPISNTSHIVSTLLHCGLQRNEQHRTHNQRLVSHPRKSTRQREELLVLFPNVMECQTKLDPANPSLPSF
jgi:hypothetical protein